MKSLLCLCLVVGVALADYPQQHQQQQQQQQHYEHQQHHQPQQQQQQQYDYSQQQQHEYQYQQPDQYQQRQEQNVVDADNEPSFAGFVRYLRNGVSSGIRRMGNAIKSGLGFGRASSRRSPAAPPQQQQQPAFPGATRRQGQQAQAQAQPRHSYVWFNITVDGKPAGRINMELFDEVAPRTVENFKALAHGLSNGAGYAGSTFHRVIPGFMLQGGDFEKGDGTGGYSIYGKTFEDESFFIKHETPGLLSMANAGPDTNGSQFFITVAKTPWLDGKHVVFGRLVKDQETWPLVQRLERLGTQSGETKKKIAISASGVY